MIFEFYCHGHENILSLHRNTIEFTKDSGLTKNGDCIIGVSADYCFDKLTEFLKKNRDKRIKAEILADGLKDDFSFMPNPDFSDKHEIVIRKTDFKSSRTLGILADKAAKDIKKELVERIRNKNIKFKVIFIS